MDVDSTLNPTVAEAAPHRGPREGGAARRAAGARRPDARRGRARGAASARSTQRAAPSTCRSSCSWRRHSGLDRHAPLAHRPGHEGARAGVRARAGEETRQSPEILHKNLMPVAYVTGDLAGAIESPLYALLALEKRMAKLRCDAGDTIPRSVSRTPPTPSAPRSSGTASGTSRSRCSAIWASPSRRSCSSSTCSWSAGSRASPCRS